MQIVTRIFCLNVEFNEEAQLMSQPITQTSANDSRGTSSQQSSIANRVVSPIITSVPTTSHSSTRDTIVGDSHEYQTFQRTVLEYLVKVLDNQREILRRTADNTKVKSSYILPVTVPIDSIDNLNAFNQWLAAPIHLQNTVLVTFSRMLFVWFFNKRAKMDISGC
ncbi:unnamed protein product [Orchesella dallaii]|uniref:Uncharacterized protein n=1 Tax=Orchesella dallaii TaxID=48710 RepID=A0ABP1R737_9HEXA